MRGRSKRVAQKKPDPLPSTDTPNLYPHTEQLVPRQNKGLKDHLLHDRSKDHIKIGRRNRNMVMEGASPSVQPCIKERDH